MKRVREWVKSTHYKDYAITIASADASFRKYYRLTQGQKSVIVMDSSLELESLTSFIDITQRLLNAGVRVPKIFEQNVFLGYLIIEDFGNENLLDLLNEENFEAYYVKAMEEILKMQNTDVSRLPLYDKKFLHFEMDLMQKWFLEKKLSLLLDVDEKSMLQKTLESISNVVLSQPQGVFVHRDFHSRNIMLTPQGEIAVIDYQDAMSGAISYDLVSLLKDCYREFERKKIEQLALRFRDKLGLNAGDSEFLKWFDFMGLQRHIKVLGIFSRLSLRDAKDGYLKDIPLVLKYTIETALRYEETQELAKFLKEKAL